MGRTQTETLTLRLTPEEKFSLQEKMYKAVAPSMRQFVLDMCMDGQIIVNSDLHELNAELRYQGNNLNQLTRLAHQGRITEVNLAELILRLQYILRDKHGEGNPPTIPDHIRMEIARCLLPDIIAFCESEQGKREFEEWKAKQERNEKWEMKAMQ